MVKIARVKRTGLWWAVAAVFLVLTGCTSSVPNDIENVCSIFEQKGGWYKHAKRAEKRWKIPVPVLMATIHQESRYRGRAKPARKKWLGFIPGFRPSSAYGYAQALDSTWAGYIKSSGNYGADRNKFKDAVDFVGWYHAQTVLKNSVKSGDAYRLYLAYHEGRGGFARGSYKSKPWLQKVAKKVANKAHRYQVQYNDCQTRLKQGWWPF
ncbi:MAG: hypothetical protein COB04_01955 [Gammaproteobacteria bacterium]|nr:MAG: hypothetical protein COB04_01955 [Gammaproteobacteria bacterium]